MIETIFYLLSILAVVMLLFLFRNYPINKIALGAMGLVGWICYLIVLVQTELLKEYDGFPPRIPFLVVIPAIIMIIILVNQKFMSKSLKDIPPYLPVGMQSFRIFVELLIYATYLKGIFPQRATFEGLNLDILVGISAVFMGIAAYKSIVKAKGILIWNIVSLVILTITVYSFISTYYFTDFVTTGDGYKFVEFPYLLLASMLLPAAIFLHAFSIKQILIQKATIEV